MECANKYECTTHFTKFPIIFKKTQYFIILKIKYELKSKVV